MATAAEHRAEIERINGEVATQAQKIAELSEILDGKAAGGGGGSEPVISPLTVTENGTYTAPDGVDGYSPVVVEVTSGGNTNVEDSLMDRSVTEYTNDRITELGRYSLSYAQSLTSLRLPNVISIAANGCYNCSKLAHLYLPLVQTIGAYAFQSCSSLATVDLPSAQQLGAQAFTSCSKLITLILRTNTVCTLSNSNALSKTPIADGAGYVYVPSSLVDSYKSATNWTTYVNQIRAIEDYPAITGG